MTENIIKLKGQVKKLIDRPAGDEPQQVQIFLHGADLYYDELRIPNTQKWQIGDTVEVTIRSR
jgi:hypothetical protein